jgi:hypothetical protein
MSSTKDERSILHFLHFFLWLWSSWAMQIASKVEGHVYRTGNKKLVESGSNSSKITALRACKVTPTFSLIDHRSHAVFDFLIRRVDDGHLPTYGNRPFSFYR